MVPLAGLEPARFSRRYLKPVRLTIFATFWCERRESNPHEFPRLILSQVRLPVSPRSQDCFPARHAERGPFSAFRNDDRTYLGLLALGERSRFPAGNRGAVEWYRTTGLPLTKGVLSHLSYDSELVPAGGLESPHCGIQIRCSTSELRRLSIRQPLVSTSLPPAFSGSHSCCLMATSLRS